MLNNPRAVEPREAGLANWVAHPAVEVVVPEVADLVVLAVADPVVLADLVVWEP
jgi:hypothetical protein